MYNELKASIFPIVKYDEYKGFAVEATSFYVEYKGEPFLITAAHVLRSFPEKHQLSVFLPDGLVPLNAPAVMSALPDKDSKGELDVAYFRLLNNSELFNYFNKCKPLSLIEFDNSVNYEKEAYYLFGFPASKSKYFRQKNEFEAPHLSYFTKKIEDDAVFEKYGKSQDVHILTRYDTKNTINQKREPNTPPKPIGVSGGPLFRALISKKDELLKLIPIGILIEIKEKKVMVSTKIEKLKEFIDNSPY
jgi:hypothetical protein